MCPPVAEERKLLAPFSHPIVELHAESLTLMLRAQPTVRLPSNFSNAAQCTSLLQGHINPPGSSFVNRIINALDAPLPDPMSSEMMWSSFWDNLLTNVFLTGEKIWSIGLRVDREVRDTTLTVDGMRRDFYLFLRGRPIVHGEDKSQNVGLNHAIKDLKAKHKGSSPFIYGRLKFCIGFATGVRRLRDSETHSSI